jgi:hypothetical protein
MKEFHSSHLDLHVVRKQVHVDVKRGMEMPENDGL